MNKGGYEVRVYYGDNDKEGESMLCANFPLALEVLRRAKAMINVTYIHVDALDQYGKPAYTVKTVEVRK